MVVLLGGRAAESLFYDDVSTGSADDLVKVTDIARSMVVRFGMDPKLGLVTYETATAPLLGGPAGVDWRPRQYGEETASAIDKAVRELIDRAFRRAVEILSRNRELLGRAAGDLIHKETFGAGDLVSIAAELKASPPTEGPPQQLGQAVADRPAA
jgi:cell division protease FtsH